MTEWQPIETAPKDGTVIKVRNGLTHQMDLDAKFGTFVSAFGIKYPGRWVLVKDNDPIMPMMRGSLIVPEEWQPLPAPPKAETP